MRRHIALATSPQTTRDTALGERTTQGRRRPFTITRMQRHADGHWTATVTGTGGRAVLVDNRSGSWVADLGEVLGRREVLPHVAAALQARRHKAELAERRAA